MFQDFQLISQPLGNNVAGSMNYDRERVRKALLDAGFGDRLATMEKGLDTTLYKGVYEDGVDVSGGEAQKIASRPQHLTRLRKRRSIQSSMRSQVIKRLSISLTVCPLANSAMKSLYSTRVL